MAIAALRVDCSRAIISRASPKARAHARWLSSPLDRRCTIVHDRARFAIWRGSAILGVTTRVARVKIHAIARRLRELRHGRRFRWPNEIPHKAPRWRRAGGEREVRPRARAVNNIKPRLSKLPAAPKRTRFVGMSCEMQSSIDIRPREIRERERGIPRTEGSIATREFASRRNPRIGSGSACARPYWIIGTTWPRVSSW